MDAINNFATLLQLLASVSLAFVAVDYIKTYAETLHERLFRFGEYLERIYKCCTLPDDNTINGLIPTMVGTYDTALTIEEIKRDKEKIQKQIEAFKEEQTQRVKAICESKSLSSLCFFFFLACVYLLFLGVVEGACPEFAQKASIAFCLLSYLVIFLSWFRGEAIQQWSWCNLTSLLDLFILFAICFILSLIVGSVNIDNCLLLNAPFIRWCVLLCYNILVVLSFAVSIIRIWWKIEKQKQEVRQKAEGEHLSECEKIVSEVGKIKATMDLANNAVLSTNKE